MVSEVGLRRCSRSGPRPGRIRKQGELPVESRPDAWPLDRTRSRILQKWLAPANDRLCYRFAPKSLAEALGRGQKPGNLLEFLWTHCARRREKSDSHRASYQATRALDRQLWRATYTGVSLMEVADNLVMRELSATTSVEQIADDTIGRRRRFPKTGRGTWAVEDLKRRGQSPLLHEEEYHGTK